MVYSSEQQEKKDSFVIPENVENEKIWLLEEGNCLRTQFENICNLREHKQKPKNLDFLASNVMTLVHLVDQLGGITILPELSVDLLSDNQKKQVAQFKKPYPYREISIVYYKPTYKQKIIDEFVGHIRTSLEDKLRYNKSPKEYVNIVPE